MDSETVDYTRVRNGATMLDRHLPDWHQHVDGDTITVFTGGLLDQLAKHLNMASPVHLAMDFMRSDGITHDMFAPWLYGHGMLPHDQAAGIDQLTAYANYLRTLWIDEINARRALPLNT